MGEVQNYLIEKIKNGEIWDSLSGEYINLEPQEVIKKENNYYSKTTYPDGSIKVTNIDISEISDITKCGRSVTGGTWHSGSYWWEVTGALVKENYMVFTASFRADYSGNAYNPSSIDRVYEYNIATVAASYANPRLVISRKQATSSTPARAYLSFDVTLYNSAGGFTQYVYLYVIRTEAKSDRS